MKQSAKNHRVFGPDLGWHDRNTHGHVGKGRVGHAERSGFHEHTQAGEVQSLRERSQTLWGPRGL